jgi:hypothetical protein
MRKFNRAFKAEIKTTTETIRLPEELRYEFSIDNLEQRPGQCRLRIFNANLETLSNVYAGAQLELRAGYGGVAETVIFRGQITNYFPFRQGPNLIMEVYAADWQLPFKAQCDVRTFAKSDTLLKIVTEVASQMKMKIPSELGTGGKATSVEVIVDPNNIKLGKWKKEQPFRKQIPEGTCRRYLNDLAKTYKLYWWVQNGYFHMRYSGLTRTAGEKIYEVSAHTGMMSTPQITAKGVSVTVLMEPELQIDSIFKPVLNRATVNVANKFYAPLQGFKDNAHWYQRVHQVKHRGDTRGAQWVTDLVGMHLFGEEAGV